MENAVLTPIRHKTNRIRFCVKVGDLNKKLFAIQFNNSSKGFQIFVDPYTSLNNGLISCVTHHPNQSDIDLVPTSFKTSYNVKYSHAVDGHVHFSQCGKIFGSISNKASRLDQYAAGHLFTITIADLKKFNDANVSKSCHNLNLDLIDYDENKLIKFTGWWYHSSVTKINKKEAGPIITYEKDGVRRNGIILAPCTKDPFLDQRFLMLVYEQVPKTEDNPSFVLMGGFEPNVKADKNLHFLMMAYPFNETKEEHKKILSLDYSTAREKPLPIFD